ncbi:TPA: IS1 family transposase [Escherichia coli]|nr:IS1 family transposase [Escherichia coli]EFA1366101.1 IS1 family transposase [Escherichia coli]EFD9928703.1 IS1 family transposase [Escherichia coli]EFD9929499.1 IS1 family transposase [Escherichia coli]HBB0930747.1 IS1 family transposase [Escherichia coli]
MASVSISCPSCSATDGVVRNGKSTAGHQRYLCSHCRKTWQLQFTYTASQPGTHQKIRHCCKVSDEAAFCLIQRPYISKTLLTRRISPRGSP